MVVRVTEKTLKLPGLFECALMILEDGCPPEPRMQLCQMQEVDDGSMCTECWRRYLLYVANGRRAYDYRREWVFEGGTIG